MMNLEARSSQLSKSLVRYLSPQGGQSGQSVIPSARETLSRVQQSVQPLPREHVIPLDLQYTTTKKVEQFNTSDYEVKIETLQRQSELWRKRYLDLMAVYDKQVANQEIISVLENRIQLILKENEDVWFRLRGVMTENDQLSMQIQNLEMQISLSKQNDEEFLRDEVKQLTVDLDEWRDKYYNLDERFQQFNTLEIRQIQNDNEVKVSKGQLQQWEDNYWKVVEEKNELLKQIKLLNDKYSQVQIEQTERAAITDIKLKDIELLRLHNHMIQLGAAMEEWRMKALKLESVVDERESQVEIEKSKNSKLNEQIAKLNVNIQGKDRNIEDLVVQIEQLEQQLGEVQHLKQEIENLLSVVELKDKSDNDLRKEIARLENANSELRHEKLLKVEFENENKRLSERSKELVTMAADRKTLVDQLKIKVGNLEIDNNVLTQQLEQIKYLTLENEQVSSENKAIMSRVRQLENLNEDYKHELLELQARQQQLLLLEVDLKRINALLVLKDREIAQLRSKLTQLESVPKVDTAGLEKQIKISTTTIQQLKEDISIKQTEINKLHQINTQLNYEITKIEIANDLNVPDNSSAINEWKFKFEEAQQHIEGLQQSKEQLLNNQDFLNSEMESLQKQLQVRRQEIEEWRRQAGMHYLDASESKKLLSELEIVKSKLQNENTQLNAQNTQLQKALQASIITQQQSELNHNKLQLKQSGFLNKLNQDVQILTIDYQGKLAEADQWKAKYLQSEQLNHDLKGIEDKYNYSTARVQQLTNDNLRLNQMLKEVPMPESQSKESSGEDNKIILMWKQRFEKLNQDYVNTAIKIPLLEQQLLDKDTTALEQRVEQLLKEIQRVNTVYQAKVRDAEELRNKSNSLETTVVEMRFLEKRVPDLQNRVSALQVENKELMSALTISNMDQEKLTQTINKQTLQLKNYSILQSEFAAMKSAQYSKDQEISKLKTQVYLLDTELQNLVKSKEELIHKYELSCTEGESSKKALVQRQQDADRLQVRLSRSEVKAVQVVKLQQKIKAIEQQLSAAVSENNTKTYEINQLTDKLKVIQGQLEQQQFYNSQITPFKNRCQDLNELVQVSEHQVSELQKQLYSSVESKNREIAELQQSNNNLQQYLNKTQQQLQIIPELEMQLENQGNQLQQLSEKIGQLEQDNFQYKVKNEGLVLSLKKYQVMEQDYNKLREANDQLIDQIDEVKRQLSAKEAEAAKFQAIKDGLEARVALLASEIERLQHMLKSKNDEISTLKESLQRLETIVSTLSSMEGDCRRSGELIIQQKAEIEQGKEQLALKIKEYDELRSQRETVENKVALMSSEIERLRIRLGNTDAQLQEQLQNSQKWQDECEDLRRQDGVKQELEARVQSQSQLSEQLQQQLAAKNKELLQIKQNVSDLESQIQQFRENALDESKLQASIMILNREKEEISLKVDQLQRLIEKLEKNKNDLESKCAMLASEVERINHKYKINQQENKQLQDQVSMMRDETDRLAQQLQNAQTVQVESHKRGSMNQASLIASMQMSRSKG